MTKYFSLFCLMSHHSQFLHFSSGVFQHGAIKGRSSVSGPPGSTLHFHAFTWQEEEEGGKSEMRGKAVITLASIHSSVKHTYTHLY